MLYFTIFIFFSIITEVILGENIWHLKNNRPSDVNQIDICEGCQIFARVAIKLLVGKKSEDDIYNLMTKQNICKPDYVSNGGEGSKYILIFSCKKT